VAERTRTTRIEDDKLIKIINSHNINNNAICQGMLLQCGKNKEKKRVQKKILVKKEQQRITTHGKERTMWTQYAADHHRGGQGTHQRATRAEKLAANLPTTGWTASERLL
jgi:hypothetical protein